MSDLTDHTNINIEGKALQAVKKCIFEYAIMVSASSCLCVVAAVYCVCKWGSTVHVHACMHHMCVCIVLQRGGWCTIERVHCISGSGCNS